MEQDIAQVLISAEQIAARNRELAAEIAADHEARRLTVVIVSSGALLFAADLVRQIPLPLQLDVISAKSYVGTQSSRQVNLLSQLHVSLHDRDVLIVDDIFDSGLTLSTLVRELGRLEPGRIRTCVLLDKQRPRETAWRPDYIGFPIADQFVVGYGLDYRELYRNLPYVGVLHPHLYRD
jgi:hypoxanthine phosphoribosyltransferase